jgi:hypothetical protein
MDTFVLLTFDTQQPLINHLLELIVAMNVNNMNINFRTAEMNQNVTYVEKFIFVIQIVLIPSNVQIV